MSRPTSASIPSHLRGCVVVITCVAAIVGVTPARAGLGGLMKKAKEAAQVVTKKLETEAPATAAKVEFNDVILELTSDRIQHILAAFKSADKVSAGRSDLIQKQTTANYERIQLFEKNREAIEAVRNKRGDLEVCYHDGYQEATERRMEEYREKALTDPTIREKFARAAQQHNEAAARGDSTAIAKIQETIHEVTAPTREDSAQVRRKCGPVPPRLPAEDRLAALDQQITSLGEQIRKIDENVAEVQAAEGGLNLKQWGMALERLQLYLAWRQSKSYSKSATRGFSETEIKALEQYLAELQAALG